jgi:hypothetical protein
MDKYILVFDYGKPQEEKYKTKQDLIKRLVQLKELSIDEDYPYFDVCIYDNEKDISQEIFKELEGVVENE